MNGGRCICLSAQPNSRAIAMCSVTRVLRYAPPSISLNLRATLSRDGQRICIRCQPELIDITPTGSALARQPQESCQLVVFPLRVTTTDSDRTVGNSQPCGRRARGVKTRLGLMTQLTFPLASTLAFCRIIRNPDAGKF